MDDLIKPRDLVSREGWCDNKTWAEPHAQAARLAHDDAVGSCLPSMRRQDAAWNALPVAWMAAGRCRMHGGASTGPRTSEGLQRIAQATTHGGYSVCLQQRCDFIR